MKTGAIILAAGLSSRMGSFKPMLEIGGQSVVKRVIRVFQQAGADPVVLVTGHQAERLEAHVAAMGVVCLRNEQYASTQMLESIKIGLRYLNGKCGRILLTPVDVPLFSADTVRRLINAEALIAAPVYQNRKGHPLLLSGDSISYVEAYDSAGGLAGAIREGPYPLELIEVDDQGILPDMDTPEEYERLRVLFAHRG